MRHRLPPPAGLAETGGRTYVALWRFSLTDGEQLVPLGTVVAATRTSAVYEAGRRWPAARGRLQLTPAGAAPTGVLLCALANDASRH